MDKRFEVTDSELNDIKDYTKDNNNINNTNNNEVEKTEHNSKQSNSSTSDLHKVFEAPIIPFGGTNSNKMKKSTSDYSISTIGEFSPSSSEWTNDSPNLKNIDNMDPDNLNTDANKYHNKSESSHIPSTKAVRNISKLVEDSSLYPSSQVNKLETTLQERSDNDGVNRNNNDGVIDDKGEVNHEFKLFANKSPDNASTLSTESNTVSSIDKEFEMYMEDKGLQMSTTSVTSYNSLHKNQKSDDVSNMGQVSDVQPTIDYTERQESTTQSLVFKHPLVQEMYDPILTRIDILMKQIDDIIRR